MGILRHLQHWLIGHGPQRLTTERLSGNKTFIREGLMSHAGQG